MHASLTNFSEETHLQECCNYYNLIDFEIVIGKFLMHNCEKVLNLNLMKHETKSLKRYLSFVMEI